MKMRPVDVLNNLKGHVLWPQSYHLSEDEAAVCIEALEIMRKTGVRDCEHCRHYKPKGLKEGCAYAWGCEIWDCKLEPTGPDNGESECGK